MVNARALKNTQLLYAIQRSGDRQATSEEGIEEIGVESALDIPSTNCISGREAERRGLQAKSSYKPEHPWRSQYHLSSEEDAKTCSPI
ncbi:uncharacterized protein LOC143023564 isoform X4 [Oratosquilla oratoria]|uniref:uncharacterized protein LOC143023564 isoform X4 n=1 Tax=Oratosquilla oratoria TaxID=337810 RepID=UPI003F76F470